MSRIGEAVGEHGAGLDRLADHLVDLARDQGSAHGQIARCQPLCAGDQVGRHLEERIGGEELAQPAETCDDLVGDDENAVPLADLRDAAEIPGGRLHHASHAHDRFREEGRHLVRPDLFHLLLELSDEMVAEGLERHAVRASIGVGCRDVVDVFLGRVEADLVEIETREGGRYRGAAVVGAPSADDVLSLGLAQVVEVMLDDP